LTVNSVRQPPGWRLSNPLVLMCKKIPNSINGHKIIFNAIQLTQNFRSFLHAQTPVEGIKKTGIIFMYRFPLSCVNDPAFLPRNELAIKRRKIRKNLDSVVEVTQYSIHRVNFKWLPIVQTTLNNFCSELCKSTGTSKFRPHGRLTNLAYCWLCFLLQANFSTSLKTADASCTSFLCPSSVSRTSHKLSNPFERYVDSPCSRSKMKEDDLGLYNPFTSGTCSFSI